MTLSNNAVPVRNAPNSPASQRAALLVALVMFVLADSLYAQPLPGVRSVEDGIEACRVLDDPERRLACYDALPGPSVTDPPTASAVKPDANDSVTRAAHATSSAPPEGTAEPAVIGLADTPLLRSRMTRMFELDDATHGGLLHVRRHEPVYLLPGRWSSRPNERPFVDLPGALPPEQRNLDPVEIKFQLSLKTKLADNLIGDNVDLWAAYTQQSNWQAYNTIESEPFRETNYAPEIFASVRTGLDLLGWRWQMVNLGFVHQSNGRADPLSRSWNRVYAAFGFERENLRLLVRPWWEIAKSSEDNPDIDDYMGWGDIRLDWTYGDHDFGLMGRWAPGERRGAMQFDWHYPLYGDLKAYLQVFSGYGETLIDYNHRQTTIGLGISLVQ
jgi:phospholipase A1